MNIVYAQKPSTVQNIVDSKVSSVLDNSSQSESLQRKADLANNAAQRAEVPQPNNTGMPDNLKSGIESLSGFSMDDVRVHYNSSKPATVQALAYTQGTDIHVAPGQEKHLPHEAWHVAQQMAGRVSPTTNINGMPVNDNAGLEHEADVMGEKAVGQRKEANTENKKSLNNNGNNVCQMLRVINAYEFFNIPLKDADGKMYWNKVCKQFRDGAMCLSSTNNLRKKYIHKAKNLLDKFSITSNETKRKKKLDKLRSYAPDIKESDNYSTMKEKIRTRIKANVKTDDFSVGPTENLVINAHGEFNKKKQKVDKFAGSSPQEFASKVIGLLPNEYSGEIYLCGCHTGQEYQTKNGYTSYIEEFRKALMKQAKKKHITITPAIKGNRNASKPLVPGEAYPDCQEDGVYVESWKTGEIKKKFVVKDGLRYYKGKIGKLHIDQNGIVLDSLHIRQSPSTKTTTSIWGRIRRFFGHKSSPATDTDKTEVLSGAVRLPIAAPTRTHVVRTSPPQTSISGKRLPPGAVRLPMPVKKQEETGASPKT